MGRIKFLSVFIWLLIPFSSSSCLIIKDSPAPGCVEYIGFSSMGGCFGKTAIVDLNVETDEACVKIDANNCNGGVLEVHNKCNEAVILNGIVISPSDMITLDVRKSDSGGTELIKISTNFSDFIPEFDQFIEIAGKLGDQQLNVTYIKTKPLCK